MKEADNGRTKRAKQICILSLEATVQEQGVNDPDRRERASNQTECRNELVVC